MVPIARRNLLTEKGRLVMSVAGVAFAVLLILIVVSLYRGWSEASWLFSELPGELWVSQEGTSDPFRSTSFLPAEARSTLEQIPGVALVMPVYARRVAVGHGGARLNVFFMSLAAPAGTALPPNVRERFFPAPGHVSIDSTFAKEANVGVGDTVRILRRGLTVEHVNPGGNPIFELAFLDASDATELLAVDDFVSFFLLSLRPGASVDAVSAAAAAAVPRAETHTSSQYADATGEVVNQGFLPVVGALVGIGFVIGGAVKLEE